MKFLVIGNLTKDIIRTGIEEKVTFGGIASYGSITAAKLGCETHVLSRGNHELDGWIEELKGHGINVELQRSDKTTFFVNDYTHGNRIQHVPSDAGKIDYKSSERMDIIHIGPVFNEITLECIKEARRNCDLLSLDVQGFVRGLRNEEVIDKFWDEKNEFLKYFDLVKLSEREVGSISDNKNHEKICSEIIDLGVKVVELTLGDGGSIIVGKEVNKIPVYRVKSVDKTGSGDVFGTAFAIKYFDTKDERDSGLFASAAASFVVEDFGTKNIKGKDKVMKRFTELKSNN